MGAAASLNPPFPDVDAALAAGKTQEEIDAWIKTAETSAPAAEAPATAPSAEAPAPAPSSEILGDALCARVVAAFLAIDLNGNGEVPRCASCVCNCPLPPVSVVLSWCLHAAAARAWAALCLCDSPPLHSDSCDAYYISKVDLKELTAFMGEEARGALAQLDTNKDGIIEVGEFIKFFEIMASNKAMGPVIADKALTITEGLIAANVDRVRKMMSEEAEVPSS